MEIQRYNHEVETEYPWYSSMSDDPHGNYVLYSNYETVIAAKDAEIAALDKENIVMRQQMVKLIDERDALRAQLERADALADATDNLIPVAIWFFKGPYGPTPEPKAMQEAIDALALYNEARNG